MQPAITIYSSPSCGFCHMAREYFDKKGLKYTDTDITTDEAGYNFVTKEVGQAVTPIITIDDSVIIGFDRPKIDQTLAAGGGKKATAADKPAHGADDDSNSSSVGGAA